MAFIDVDGDDDDDDDNNNNNNNHISNYKKTTVYYFKFCPWKPVARGYNSRALIGRSWL